MGKLRCLQICVSLNRLKICVSLKPLEVDGKAQMQCSSPRAAPAHFKLILGWPEGPAQNGFGQTALI